MAQTPPFQPGIGFPPDGPVELLRKIVWNTWLIGTSGGSGGISWVAAPASSSASGSAGQVAYDGSYFYICVSASSWRRVPISDWS